MLIARNSAIEEERALCQAVLRCTAFFLEALIAVLGIVRGEREIGDAMQPQCVKLVSLCSQVFAPCWAEFLRHNVLAAKAIRITPHQVNERHRIGALTLRCSFLQARQHKVAHGHLAHVAVVEAHRLKGRAHLFICGHPSTWVSHELTHCFIQLATLLGGRFEQADEKALSALAGSQAQPTAENEGFSQLQALHQLLCW